MEAGTGYRRESIRRLTNRKWLGITMLGGIIVVILVGSAVMLKFEKPRNPEIQHYGDALWMDFVTMTTVGYGDKVPVTLGGKVTAIMIVLFGLTLLTGFITTRAGLSADKAQRRIRGLDQDTKLHDHFVICGWNYRGKYVVERLANAMRKDRVPIVLLAELETSPLEEELLFFYYGSPTRESDLRRVNIAGARSVVLLADESSAGSNDDRDAKTVLAALAARSLNPDVMITAEVLEPENIQHMKRAGVQEVFDHNLIAGNLLAQSAMRFGVIEFVTALAERDANAKLFLIAVPEELKGKTCEEAAEALERGKNYTLLGVRKPDGFHICQAALTVESDDRLMVMSEAKPPDAEF
jgi:voltage-gated potassium channel